MTNANIPLPPRAIATSDWGRTSGIEVTRSLGLASITNTAAQLLITAGSNPHRLHSKAAFAALFGVVPVPASSGKTNRHRHRRHGGGQAGDAGRLRADRPAGVGRFQRRAASFTAKPPRWRPVTA